MTHIDGTSNMYQLCVSMSGPGVSLASCFARRPLVANQVSALMDRTLKKTSPELWPVTTLIVVPQDSLERLSELRTWKCMVINQSFLEALRILFSLKFGAVDWINNRTHVKHVSKIMMLTGTAINLWSLHTTILRNVFWCTWLRLLIRIDDDCWFVINDCMLNYESFLPPFQEPLSQSWLAGAYHSAVDCQMFPDQ